MSSIRMATRWKWHWHGSWCIEHRAIFGGPCGGRFSLFIPSFFYPESDQGALPCKMKNYSAQKYLPPATTVTFRLLSNFLSTQEILCLATLAQCRLICCCSNRALQRSARASCRSRHATTCLRMVALSGAAARSCCNRASRSFSVRRGTLTCRSMRSSNGPDTRYWYCFTRSGVQRHSRWRSP